MKPIDPNDRKIVNIHQAAFIPFVYPDGTALGDSVLQLDDSQPLGIGFHVYRMPPGMTVPKNSYATISDAPGFGHGLTLDNIAQMSS